MKTALTLLSVSMFLSSNAFADCPDLSGRYLFEGSCETESPYKDGKLVLNSVSGQVGLAKGDALDLVQKDCESISIEYRDNKIGDTWDEWTSDGSFKNGMSVEFSSNNALLQRIQGAIWMKEFVREQWTLSRGDDDSLLIQHTYYKKSGLFGRNKKRLKYECSLKKMNSSSDN